MSIATRPTSAATDPDQLLTVREACELLQVSEKHLRVLTRERGLPAVRLGRLVRYRRADLNGWIEDQVAEN